MSISETQINALVDQVVDSLVKQSSNQSLINTPAQKCVEKKAENFPTTFRGCFDDIESAIHAAEKAFLIYRSMGLCDRQKIITSIREHCLEQVETLARIARDETGLGRYEDKIEKNKLAILKTPGTEDLNSTVVTGDNGLTLFEQAPFGVIASITPCTNPSETIINNTISMIAGGNAVTFNPHPSAKKTSALTVDLINQAVIAAGGPPNLVTTILNPTIESANALMKHPKTKLLVVTGGPAVVKAAMGSGKKVIAAGPGNPPVVVDETADIDKAAKDIVMSASTDNNIICLIEKNIIATKLAADALKKALIKHGAVELTSYQTKRLEQIIVDGDHPHKDWVGKDIQLILKQIDMDVDASKRLAFAEVTKDHPFAQIEMLMPVLPFIRAKDIDDAIDIAFELEGGRGHTAMIHSKNIDHMHKMAVKMNTSIFVKNGPGVSGLGMGGEGAASFTIASPTGEGVTTAKHFTRIRRCVLNGHFRIV